MYLFIDNPITVFIEEVEGSFEALKFLLIKLVH
jgi:hypothetical protein